MYNLLLKPLLISILVAIAGVCLYAVFSGNDAINITNTTIQQSKSVEANNNTMVVGNLTIQGQGELVKEKSGKIAGVLQGPIVVNVTP